MGHGQLFIKDWKKFIGAGLEANLRLIITKTIPQGLYVIDF